MNKVNAHRVPWNVFPDVYIHCDEKTVKFHPHYLAAKQGDANAALHLIDDTFNPDSIHTVAQWKRNSTPILVSVHAEEEMGRNAIPEVLADALAMKLGWEADAEIVQANIVNHTGADGFSRMARQAVFAGTVRHG